MTKPINGSGMRPPIVTNGKPIAGAVTPDEQVGASFEQGTAPPQAEADAAALTHSKTRFSDLDIYKQRILSDFLQLQPLDGVRQVLVDVIDGFVETNSTLDKYRKINDTLIREFNMGICGLLKVMNKNLAESSDADEATMWKITEMLITMRTPGTVSDGETRAVIDSTIRIRDLRNLPIFYGHGYYDLLSREWRNASSLLSRISRIEFFWQHDLRNELGSYREDLGMEIERMLNSPWSDQQMDLDLSATERELEVRVGSGWWDSLDEGLLLRGQNLRRLVGQRRNELGEHFGKINALVTAIHIGVRPLQMRVLVDQLESELHQVLGNEAVDISLGLINEPIARPPSQAIVPVSPLDVFRDLITEHDEALGSALCEQLEADIDVLEMRDGPIMDRDMTRFEKILKRHLGKNVVDRALGNG